MEKTDFNGHDHVPAPEPVPAAVDGDDPPVEAQPSVIAPPPPEYVQMYSSAREELAKAIVIRSERRLKYGHLRTDPVAMDIAQETLNSTIGAILGVTMQLAATLKALHPDDKTIPAERDILDTVTYNLVQAHDRIAEETNGMGFKARVIRRQSRHFPG